MDGNGLICSAGLAGLQQWLVPFGLDGFNKK